MKIKYSKDYNFNEWLIKRDTLRFRSGEQDFSYSSYIESTWEEADVNFKELQELINKGYAIKINC